MKQIKQKLPLLIMFLLAALIIALTIRGVYINPDDETLNAETLANEGPLELSPERGRFALTYSLVENKSFQFSLPVARFVTPDLGYINGSYVSLFPPGVSLFVIPGYIIGKYFGASQFGTYAVIGVISILNVLLIYLIAKTIGANKQASIIAGLIFLFATPAFAYAVSLYQHHITVFLLLLCLYLLLKWKDKIWPLFIVWMLIGVSLMIDYPNVFLFLPLGIYSIAQIFSAVKVEGKVRIKFKLVKLIALSALIIPISVFLWINKESYGNPFQLAGTVKSVEKIDIEGNPIFSSTFDQNQSQTDVSGKTATNLFSSRFMLHGLYIHTVSNERGIIFFTPVMLLSLFGYYFLQKRKRAISTLLLSIVGINILLYSMWGDPWGGWAFGSRYLIPLFAVLSIFLAYALTGLRRNVFILLLFFVLTIYSVSVNTLGALTTNRVPPKVEADALGHLSGRKEDYTYWRNWEFLMSNRSKSFVYQTFVKDYLTVFQYYYLVVSSIMVIISGQITYMYLKSRKER